MPRPGPAPKDPSVRVRRNKDTAPHMQITFVPGVQPELPDGFPWPDRTREWWATWGASPLAEHMMAVDWQVLLAGALVHSQVWGAHDLFNLGRLIAIEKDFGATFTARLQLRIQAEAADEVESKGRERRTKPAGVKQPAKKSDPRKLFAVS